MENCNGKLNKRFTHFKTVVHCIQMQMVLNCLCIAKINILHIGMLINREKIYIHCCCCSANRHYMEYMYMHLSVSWTHTYTYIGNFVLAIWICFWVCSCICIVFTNVFFLLLHKITCVLRILNMIFSIPILNLFVFFLLLLNQMHGKWALCNCCCQLEFWRCECRCKMTSIWTL